MPDKSDYLQFTLENILNQISEVKELISDSSKSNLVFRDEMIARITALELRVNTIETEKNLVKGFMSSDWFKKLLYLAGAGLMGFLGANSGAIGAFLEFFK